jgi:imidazole glycerol phosphate synthase subunit HisF
MSRSERPAPSPAAAKAIYVSLVALGGKATMRNLARAINSSGLQAPLRAGLFYVEHDDIQSKR